MRLYIAGPMSGIPHFNFPSFDRVTRYLRQLGHDPINPATIGPPAALAAARRSATGDGVELQRYGFDYAETLGEDVCTILRDADGVVLLRHWSKSVGARIEAATAVSRGLPVFSLVNGQLLKTSPSDILELFRIGIDDTAASTAADDTGSD